MSECTHDCSSCHADCDSRANVIEKEKPHELSHIKKVIGVVSGKGGVGKSLVTSLMAVTMQRRGYKTAILDADITGPSIPKVFGINEHATGDDNGLYPVKTKTGIDIMSVNLLLENPSDPVVWRGPVIGGVVKQFWSEVVWGNVDYMFVDMPPGTGDVPLTVFQSLPIDGVIVVTSPQDLVSMIVTKAVKMAELMEIPILGIVENYSYFKCPDCGKEHAVFGESKVEQVAAGLGLKVLARLPIDSALASACDNGGGEDYQPNPMAGVAEVLERL